jgi:hypothetical protein
MMISQMRTLCCGSYNLSGHCRYSEANKFGTKEKAIKQYCRTFSSMYVRPLISAAFPLVNVAGDTLRIRLINAYLWKT